MKTVQIVGTEQFWELMCDERFVRVSHHQGRIGDTKYFTSTPPEDVEGFLASQARSIVDNLGGQSAGWPISLVRAIPLIVGVGVALIVFSFLGGWS